MGNNATPATDMWAVGCIGYEICLGQQLSLNNNRAPIDNHIRGGPLDLSCLDQRYDAQIRFIIHGCLELDPSRRWSAVTLRDYIQNLARQSGSYLFG
jgi:serine/threonine protein kinase